MSDRPAREDSRKWLGASVRLIPALAAGTLLLAATLIGSSGVDAAIVPTIGLGTSSDYSVLAGTTVTNTGPSTLEQNNGVSPGAAIVGFPPGTVLGTTHEGDAEALQAQSDLTVAYVEAANRPINETTAADLGGRTLVGGVYAGPNKGALSLTGPLVLDGQGDPNSVFIFQTDSTLITAEGSTVSMINGAQQCNVFWQVGSSATLGTGSTFSGNILALTSITVNTGVTVSGRALARNGAVTLDTGVFTTPPCDLTTPTTTTEVTSTTTDTGVTSTTTDTGDTSTTTDTGGGASTVPGDGTPGAPGPRPNGELPRTGRATSGLTSIAGLLLLAGIGVSFIARRSHA